MTSGLFDQLEFWSDGLFASLEWLTRDFSALPKAEDQGLAKDRKQFGVGRFTAFLNAVHISQRG
jgi:hypothetical protein